MSPSFFGRLLNSNERWAEVGRYICGCGCGLLLKIAVSGIATACGAPITAAYLIGHLATLIEAFIFHSLVTFRKRFTSWGELGKDLSKYASAVAAVKVLDYFAVVVLCSALRERLIGSAGGWKLQLFNGVTITAVTGLIFVLRYLLYRKIFRPAETGRYTGGVRSAYVVHAADREIAENAASGGFCTALLAGMLRRGEIDGALVAVMDWSGDDPPSARGVIVRDRAGLIAAQGSIYFDFPLLSAEVMRQIREFPGRLAVVALPCQAAALKRMCEREPDLAEKIVLVVGLFCGHATRRELLLRVLDKKGMKPGGIANFRFRCGHWRGRTRVRLADGGERDWPTSYYNLYQNLYVFCAKRCLACVDHFAEAADLSCGDIWRLKYRNAPAKPSMVAVRTVRGERALNAAVAAGELTAEAQTERELFLSNSRSAIFHKAVAARKKVFSRYGFDMALPAGAAKPRWNELLAARIVARYWAAPEKALATSRRRLKFWLYVFKALTSF